MQHPRNHRKLLLVKPIVMIHIPHNHLQEVIERARNEVTLQNLLQLSYHIVKVSEGVAGLLVERNLTIHREQISEFAPVHDGHISVNIPISLQAFDSFVNGGFGKIDLLTNLLIGQVGVLLKKSQDLAVGFIKHWGFGVKWEGRSENRSVWNTYKHLFLDYYLV